MVPCPKQAAAAAGRALVVLATIASAAGCSSRALSGRDADRPAAQDAVSLFDRPWTWTDERGANVALRQWHGQEIVLAAFFTQCTTRCPLTIHKLREMDAAFAREGRSPQFVLVTLDPENDTPKRLGEFKRAEALPPSWHLLVGTVAETEEIEDLLGIHVMAMDTHLVHNSRIMLFDAVGLPTRSFGGSSFGDEGPVL